MQNFKEPEYYFNKLGLTEEFKNLSDELRSILFSNLELKSYHRNEMILAPQKVCRHIYFVLEGASRNMIVRNGKDITTALTFEGQVTLVVDSFLSARPSFEGIQALEDTLCYRLEHDAYNYLLNNYLEFNIVTNRIRNDFFREMSHTLNSLRGLSALERYEFCIQNKPLFVQRVPVRYLASFLGMSHETLSRMRSLV